MLDQIGIKVIASGVGAFLADLGRAEAAEKHFADTVKKSEGEVGEASKKAAAEVQKAADQKERAAQRASMALKAVSVVATGIFVAGITAAVKSAMNFEESMDQVGAVAQATEADMKSLRQEALKIGADTSFSAGQAAKAMHELAAGGRSVAKILGGEARAAVALAEAGNYGLAESAKTIATAMDIWKDSTLETNTVVNMLAGAANTSRFGVEDMAMAIAQGGGVAAQAGVSFEEFSTAVAVTASSFASGSDAGTSFKTFLTSLSGTSDIAKEKMAELGLKFYDVQGALLPMPEIVQQLHDKLGPLSQEAQTVALKVIFGNDAFRTAAQLMKLTGEEFAATQQTMQNTSGLDVAVQRMSNAEGGIEQFKGSVETLGISFGTVFIPMVTQATGVLTGLVNKLGELPPEVLVIGTLTGLALAATPALLSMAAAAKTAATSLGLTLSMTLAIAAPLAILVGGLIAIELIADKMGKKGILERIFGSDGPSQAERLATAMERIQRSVAGMSGERSIQKINADFEKANKQVFLWNQQLDEAIANQAALVGAQGRVQPGRMDEYKDYEEQIERIKNNIKGWSTNEGALAIALYEANGGKTMSAEAAAEVAKIYYRLDPATRKWVDAESELGVVVKNNADAHKITSGLASEVFDIYAEGERTLDGIAVTTGEAERAHRGYSQVFEASLDDWETAEERLKLVNDRLQDLISTYGDFNPEVLAAKTSIALLNMELGDLERAGLGESDRAVAIKAEIDGLQGIVDNYGEVEAAINAYITQITGLGLLSTEELTPIIQAFRDMGYSGDDLTGALGRIRDSTIKLKDGSILEAAGEFNTFFEEIGKGSPAALALMEELGPEIVAAITSKIDDPIQQQMVLDSINNLFGTSYTLSQPTIDAGAQKLGERTGRGVVQGIDQSRGAVAEALGTAIDAAVTAKIPGAEIAGAQVGFAIDSGAGEGVDANKEGVSDSAGSMVEFVVDQNTGKASIKGQEIGSQLDDGTSQGIADGQGVVNESMAAMVEAAVAHGGANAEMSAEEIGRMIMNGIRNGILNNQYLATSAAATAAGATMAEFAATVENTSPSKWGKRQGKYIMQGIALGIDDGSDGLVKSIGTAAKAGMGEFESLFQIESPSDWGIMVGQNIMRGIELGISKGTDEALGRVMRDIVRLQKVLTFAGISNLDIRLATVNGQLMAANFGGGTSTDYLYDVGPWNQGANILPGADNGGLGRSAAERARMDLDAIKKMLSENLKDEVEMTAEEIERMFIEIRAAVARGGIGAALAEVVEDTLAEFSASLAAGTGVSNKGVMALIEHVQKRTDPDRVAWVDPQGRVQFIPRSQLPGPSMDDVANNPPPIPSRSIEEWYLVLEDNMNDGTEMTAAEMKQMFKDMRAAMEVADFPGAIKAMMEESIVEMEKSLKNLPNATVMGVIAGINAGAKVAAETTYLGTQQFKPPDNNNIDWTILKAEHDRALAERIALAAQYGVPLEELDAYIAKQREVYDPDNFIPDPPKGVRDMPGQSSFTGGGRWILHPDGSISEVPEGTFDSSSGLWYHNGAWQSDNPANAKSYVRDDAGNRYVHDPVTGTTTLIDPSLTPEDPMYDPLGTPWGGQADAAHDYMTGDEWQRYQTNLAAEDYVSRRIREEGFAGFGSFDPRTGGGFGMVHGFATGTGYVPQDMLAYLHRGEAVLPEWLNSMLGSWKDMFSGGMRGGFEDMFGAPLRTHLEGYGREGGGGIVFREGSLVVNYSGPADMARQVGEDFGDAFLRTLRSSGSNAFAGRS